MRVDSVAVNHVLTVLMPFFEHDEAIVPIIECTTLVFVGVWCSLDIFQTVGNLVGTTKLHQAFVKWVVLIVDVFVSKDEIRTRGTGQHRSDSP